MGTVWHARRSLALSCLLGFLATLSFVVSTLPTLPLYVRERGASAPEVGLAMAVVPLVAACTPLAGLDGPLLGGRRVLLPAAALLAVVPFAYPYAPDVWSVLALRLAHAVGLVLLPTFAPVTGTEALAGWQRRAPSALGAVGAWLLGPLLAGQTIARAGTGVAFLLAGLAGALALALLAVLPAAWPRLEQADWALASGRATAAEAALRLACGPIEAFLPLYALLVGVSIAQTGLLFALCLAWSIGAAPFVAYLERRGEGTARAAGLPLAALGVAGLALGSDYRSELLGMVCLGLGIGLVCGSLAARLPEGDSGRRGGLRSALPSLAQAAGSLAAGLAIPGFGEPAIFFAAAIVLAGTAILLAAVEAGIGSRQVGRLQG